LSEARAQLVAVWLVQNICREADSIEFLTDLLSKYFIHIVRRSHSDAAMTIVLPLVLDLLLKQATSTLTADADPGCLDARPCSAALALTIPLLLHCRPEDEDEDAQVAAAGLAIRD